MKNTKKRVFLAIFMLIFACLFVFTACNDDNGGKNDGTGNSGEDSTPELSVSFDENASYQLDEASIVDALNVEVVSDGVGRKVEFSIKSSTVTEDGNYIEVVIAAEDFETTIFLPYEAPLPEIRDELIPLYKFLTKRGDKSVALTASASSVTGESGEAKEFTYKTIVNKTANDVEFALVDKNLADDKAVIIFKDGALTAYGTTVSLYDLFGDDFISLPENVSDIFEESDRIDAFFTGFSQALDTVDATFNNSMTKGMGISFESRDGVYTLRADSAKLVLLVQLLYGNNETVDVNEIIDALDEKFEGAIKAGDIEISVSLTVKEELLSAEFTVSNKRTNDTAKLAVALEISKTAITLPEAFEPSVPKLQITVPFKLPQNNIDAELDIAVNIKNLLTKADENLIIANISYNEEDSIAAAVLNNRYVYIDMSRIAAMLGAPENSNFKFAYKFETNGEPATFFDFVAESIKSRIPGNVDSNDYADDDTSADEEEVDPLFENGYGSILIDEEFEFPIGITEEELRQKLFVYTYDAEENRIPYTDYIIEDFDGSASFADTIHIELKEGYDVYEYIVIYDPTTRSEKGVSLGSMPVEIGTTAADAGQCISAEVEMTDGNVEWTVYETCTIAKVDDVDVADDYVFATVGDYRVSVNRNGETLTVDLHIYDPENLKIVDFDCFGIVFIDEKATEEEIREQINAYVTYDDNSEKSVEDFEIVGFTYGDEKINITWGEYKGEVSVEYYGHGSYDDGDRKTIRDYIRTGVLANEDGVIDLRAIYEANIQLIGEVFNLDKDGKSFRITINSDDDRDLLALLNKFLGVPTDAGFEDIDEAYIISLLQDVKEEKYIDVENLFEKLTGVKLSDFISKLVIECKFSTDGKTLEFSDGGNVTYIATGFDLGFAEVADIVVTDADLDGAQDISALPNMAFAILMAIIFVA